MMRAILVLALMVWTAAAAPLVRVDLSGAWRFQAGDDPAYSRPDFDDSRWSQARLSRESVPASGAAWFRRTVELPAEAAGVPLAITLGTFADIYEVWCDGVRIGDSGGETFEQSHAARPRIMPVPAGIPAPGRTVTLAVRISEVRAGFGPFPSRLSALPDRGPYLLTDEESAPRDSVELGRLLRERLVAPSFVSSAMRALLLVILFAAWLTERRRRELLILTLLLFADLIPRFTESMNIVLDGPGSLYNWPRISSHLSASVLAWLAMEVFRIRARWAVGAIWVSVIAALAGLSPLLFRVPLFVTAILDLGVFFTAIRKAWEGARVSGWRSGGVGMALSIGAVAILHSQRLSAIRVMNLYQQVGGYLFQLYDVLFLFLCTGIALYQLLSLGADRREKERLAAEMEAARTVQQILLTPAPVTEDYHTEAVCEPALEVGGDFYWMRLEDDGSLMVAVGDVSGKGLRAAMLASMATGVLRHSRGMRPGALLREMNEALLGSTGGGFITCCCARLERDGTLAVANAGHLVPYLGGKEMQVEPGLPLGIAGEAQYRETAARLASGQALVLVSDGVVEAASASGELFGFPRLEEMSLRPAVEIVEAARRWGQNDDITVVTVRRAG